MRVLTRVCIASVAILVTACSSSNTPESSNSNSPESVNTGSELTFLAALPTQLRNLNTIDNRLLEAEVNFDGIAVDLNSSSDMSEWNGGIDKPDELPSEISITWYFDNLALAGKPFPIDPDSEITTIILSEDSYTSTGQKYDFDRDSYSNLEELEQGLDPKNDQVPGVPDVDLFIPKISPTDAPIIDGFYDQIWRNAVVQDRQGNELAIDNLVSDNLYDDQGLDGATGFSWAAMHDGEYLYIMVSAEAANQATIYGDSTDLRRDDGLHLFLDGDNTKGDNLDGSSGYDGINDYHFLLPFTKLLTAETSAAYVPVLESFGDLIIDRLGQMKVELADGSQIFAPVKEYEANSGFDADTRVYLWPKAVQQIPPGMAFANCICESGTHDYEIRVKIDEMGIEGSLPFGIELMLTDDTDGADFNYQYSWKHPSRTNLNLVQTWINPSYMGTAILRQ